MPWSTPRVRGVARTARACRSRSSRARASTRDGSNPTLLYGYGGYGISMSPYFSPLLRLWLDYGGVYAVANVRGGGEFGEPWHLAGNLTKKQNVFDDFAASLQMLIDRGYTRPEKAAIMGGSNGGLPDGCDADAAPAADARGRERRSASTTRCAGRCRPTASSTSPSSARSRIPISSARCTPIRLSSTRRTATRIPRCCSPPATTTGASRRTSRAR